MCCYCRRLRQRAAKSSRPIRASKRRRAHHTALLSGPRSKVLTPPLYLPTGHLNGIASGVMILPMGDAISQVSLIPSLALTCRYPTIERILWDRMRRLAGQKQDKLEAMINNFAYALPHLVSGHSIAEPDKERKGRQRHGTAQGSLQRWTIPDGG